MSFNVVINSRNKFGGSDDTDQTYALDWSFMPDGDYDMTFSFRTETKNLDYNKDVQAIECPDLAVFNCYKAADTATAQTSATIGVVKLADPRKDYNDTARMYCYADFKDNPPIRVAKPKANFFTVRLIDATGAVLSENPGNYTLILHFEKVAS